MAIPYIYKPDDIDIYMGIPTSLDLLGVPVSIELTDWVSLTKTDNSAKFTRRTGVLREQFLSMSGDDSCKMTLTILQTSDQVEQLDYLMTLQEIGLLGIPFSIIDNGSGSARRLKQVMPVTWISDRPQKAFTSEGQAWAFNFESAYQAPPIYF